MQVENIQIGGKQVHDANIVATIEFFPAALIRVPLSPEAVVNRNLKGGWGVYFVSSVVLSAISTYFPSGLAKVPNIAFRSAWV